MDKLFLVRTTTNTKVKEDIKGKGIIKLLVENETITPDLKELCELLEDLERNDLANKVLGFRPAFQNLSPSQFQDQIKKEIKQREKDHCARSSSIFHINAFKEWQMFRRRMFRHRMLRHRMLRRRMFRRPQLY